MGHEAYRKVLQKLTRKDLFLHFFEYVRYSTVFMHTHSFPLSARSTKNLLTTNRRWKLFRMEHCTRVCLLEHFPRWLGSTSSSEGWLTYSMQVSMLWFTIDILGNTFVQNKCVVVHVKTYIQKESGIVRTNLAQTITETVMCTWINALKQKHFHNSPCSNIPPANRNSCSLSGGVNTANFITGLV